MADYNVDFDDWWYFDRDGMPQATRAESAPPRFRLRPLLTLWLEFLRWVVAFALCVLLVVPPAAFSVMLAPASLVLLVVSTAIMWRHRWVWCFGRRVARFATLIDGRFVLHYDPAIRWDVSTIMPRVKAELEVLEGRFGFPLRRRLVVYLCADWQHVAEAFGWDFGGFALWDSNAIIISDSARMNELIRHELAHLFAARWNRQAPPLLAEGVAVWAENSDPDATAIACLARQEMRPGAIVDRRSFFVRGRLWQHYMVAGSFVAFLIRRYGLAKVRRLYRWSDGTRFRYKFEYCFGVPIEEAELQWRTYLWAKVRWREWPRESG